MKFIDHAKASGVYTIEGIDADGKRVFIETHNVLVQGFFTNVFTLLSGGAAALNITHLAVGSGTNAAMKADTALQTETGRKGVSSMSATATKLTVKTSIAVSELVSTWREIGIYANGTATPGSGTLISRASLNYAKTSSIQLLVTYTLTLQ